MIDGYFRGALERPSYFDGGVGAPAVGAALAPPGSRGERAARGPPLQRKTAGLKEVGKVEALL